ncbi:hypothetical protein ACF1BP_32310 [Streptomyces sp. NPDC014735]|uniref:hypothetical protein n=1 Tax=unclassified Streptomyces TaxID=2593676 RepID=UPI0036FD0D1F
MLSGQLWARALIGELIFKLYRIRFAEPGVGKYLKRARVSTTACTSWPARSASSSRPCACAARACLRAGERGRLPIGSVGIRLIERISKVSVPDLWNA